MSDIHQRLAAQLEREAADEAEERLHQSRVDWLAVVSTDQGHSILITSDSAICQGAVEIHGVAP